ncbi:UDP-N-acetylmuramoylalanine--D-glutamate ligase [Abditibacterium utsteinense]|uniref:UDP-N-acetylmuramoylalanine--D-glutamate ligase n=1 Tax=Abditibacterium utsteinense TaxID=1960156 RepID=A0A2S8SR44_9BACT|nr:UDP-N-acetylmuramoyl-L-alanine--D-glutamate ligase [Abditibacterium utsteinense]PQV63267.1 UDP-N-acetylmuramoylalanine--D-glutamate ligase [Abditibacterium utsteinense]
MNEFENKTCAVIGLARAGAPAASFLLERGAKVFGYDSKPREDLSSEALELEANGAFIFCGNHEFQDIEKCDLIVLSPGLKVHFEPLKSVIEAAESRGAEVIGELELASRFCPCPIIGVTGTKGKSTTTKLITEMLQACGVDAVSAGNTGTPLISVLPQLKPESWAIVEVSSFQLEKAPTFRPKIAVLLSLLEDHQDYHPTLEQYWETKLKIFANQGEGDSAILNSEDTRVKELGIYGTGLSQQLRDKSISQRSGIAKIYHGQLGIQPEHQFIGLLPVEELPLRGEHNIANIICALSAAYIVLGEYPMVEKRHQIADAIRNFQTLPHRLEIVAQKDGITWVNDSQSTIPDASIAALKSFPDPVTLLVGGRAKIEASAYENLMRAITVEGARLILFGEAREMLCEVASTQGVDKSQISMEKTLADAVRVAKMKASNGESVILSPACASFDQFNSYEHRGETFRQLVREL